MKKTIFFIVLIFLISCKKEISNVELNKNLCDPLAADELCMKTHFNINQNLFFGDSVLASKEFFKNLTKKTGYLTLKEQNNLYEKSYLNFKSKTISQICSDNKFKFARKLLNNKKKYRIILYTFIKEKKKDSIEFYRNVDDLKNEPSNYTCLSYLDLKNREIWQIRYFTSSTEKIVDYIFYGKFKIMETGKIEADSIYYLDESLDIEMQKNKLNFN